MPIDNSLLEGCHAIIPGLATSYGYIPSRAAGITFCVLFALTLIGHLFRSIQYRTWSSYLLTIAAATEILGWAGRTWNSKCPYNNHAFLMQITTLVIAPVFVAAAIYVVFGYLIRHRDRDEQYSLLKPKLYLWVFCTCDVIALLIQASGAGVASHQFNTGGNTTGGTHIVAGGIIFQLATMTCFLSCVVYFLVKSRNLPISRQEGLVLGAMIVSYITIYIRSVYRAVALLQGWRGELTTHERYFIALDGSMLVIALAVFNFLDPVVLLGVNKKQPRASVTTEAEIDLTSTTNGLGK
ncbi:hypothetical protein B7463_g3073, partial [Scytalidium lignicola]